MRNQICYTLKWQKSNPNISSSWAVPQLGPCYPLDYDVSQLEWGVQGGQNPPHKCNALGSPFAARGITGERLLDLLTI